MTGKAKYVSGDAWLDNPDIYADDERVYLFHDYTETCSIQNGTYLWGLGPVSDPAAVDEKGNVYLIYADKNLRIITLHPNTAICTRRTG